MQHTLMQFIYLHKKIDKEDRNEYSKKNEKCNEREEYTINPICKERRWLVEIFVRGSWNVALEQQTEPEIIFPK